MKASDGCMVISAVEAGILLDVLEGRPVSTEELETLSRVKARMRMSVARIEKRKILETLPFEPEDDWTEIKYAGT